MASSGPSGPSSSSQAESSTVDQTALATSPQKTRRPPPAPPCNRKGDIIVRPKYRPLSDLTENSLYILTFLRTSKYEPDNFHWGLYMHNNAEVGGTKLHLTGSTGGWIPDHGTTLGAMGSTKLVGAIRTADFDPSQRDKVETIIRQDDSKLHEIEPLNCRIWVSRACLRLRDEKLMDFEQWEDVRREVVDFSNGHWHSGYYNEQPRPLGFSRVCGLLD